MDKKFRRVSNFKKVKDAQYIDKLKREALPDEDMALPEPVGRKSMYNKDVSIDKVLEDNKARKVKKANVKKTQETLWAVKN